MVRLTIRRRLVLTIGTASVAVFASVGAFAVRAVHDDLVEGLDRSLTEAVEGAVATSSVLTDEQRSELAGRDTPSDHAIVVAGDTFAVTLTPASDGSEPDLTGLTATELRPRIGEPFTLRGVDGTELRAAAAELPQGYLLLYARSMAGIEETTGDLTATIGVICAVALAAMLAAVALAGRRVVRPLERMIDDAGSVRAGALGRRIPPDQPDLDTERLAEALNGMLDRLEQAFAAKDDSEQRLRRFLSDASHELRTPLTTVRAHAELLASPTLPDEQRERSVVKIQAETARMTRLVEDLLLLARLDQGQELDRHPLDLVPLARDAAADLSIVDPDRPLTVELPDRPVIVLGDPDRLRQVVDNLLANVRVHTGPGDPVRLRVATEGDLAVLEVADQGPGLAPGEAQLVFERFRRSERTAADGAPGSGLGLSIAAAVVASHHGTITLTPAARGLTVRVAVPLHDGGGPAGRPHGSVAATPRPTPGPSGAPAPAAPATGSAGAPTARSAPEPGLSRP